MIAGCYVLDLYCDKDNKAHEYKEFFRINIRQKKGQRDGTAICPKCSGLLLTPR